MKLACVALGIGISVAAVACCAVGAAGGRVRFLGQTNIVIWDQKRGIEHFIRDASFETKGKDLGFLAPTPSEPELSDVSPKAFELLLHLEPVMKEKNSDGTETAVAAAASVQVVHEQDVSGYHAAVLRATDAKGLSEWLKKNGYPAPKFLDGWAKPYVDKGWYMTAFKVKGGEEAATGPIRMTFKTSQAFNPYSVPSENEAENGQLRIYYVSAGNEAPSIGGTEPWNKALWNADLPADRYGELASYLKLPGDAIPAHASVTTYDDHHFGRPGKDDLYFVPEDGRSSLAVMGAAVALIAFAAGRRRSRRLRATS